MVNEFAQTKVHDIDEREEPLETPVYRVNYPEHFYTPLTGECYDRCSIQRINYIGYKRISHFREHLNRLQYCQFITIPNNVWIVVCHALSLQPCLTENTYNLVRDVLKEHHHSRYNEHIHYLISKFFQVHLSISPTDYQSMCLLFRQIDNVFKERRTASRKNIFSYYLVVQLILYLFHYHPFYYLPTIRNEDRRVDYYKILLDYFSSCPSFDHVLFIHESRKRHCPSCLEKNHHFDSILPSLL